MSARPVGSATISFGLVSIPVKLYSATSSQNVRFHFLHPKTGSRVKYRMMDPTTGEVVERKSLVKGYEYAKDQYVQFTEDELKSFEAASTHNLDILEFVPLASVDLVHVDKSLYLGPDRGGGKAYQLLARAMRATSQVAIGRHSTRGKEHLVLIRPYREGLILHQLFYADEVRDFAGVDLGDEVEFRAGEEAMAEQLIAHLSRDAFDVSKYRDEYRDRILTAVEQKVAGQEITVAPEQPAAQIVDLFEALKASLAQTPEPKLEPKKAEPKPEDEPKSSTG